MPQTNIAPDILQNARDVLAGRVMPPPLLTRTEGYPPPLPIPVAEMTPAQREAEEWLNLQAFYGGHPVATCRTSQGTLAVLACGYDEIDILREGLTPDELQQLTVKFPPVPIEFIPVASDEQMMDALGLLQHRKEKSHVGHDPHASTDYSRSASISNDPKGV